MATPVCRSAVSRLSPFPPSFQFLTLSAPSASRPFSSTTSLPVKAKQQVLTRYRSVPPYPYGFRPWYKKSNFGLFGLQSVRFGNNVSERNEIKTRRRWYPNVHRKRLWSISLGRFVRVKVTTRVLRTIDKVGGLDEYLLGEKAQRIKELGPGGWAIRWRIMRTDAVRERLRVERVRLGLLEAEEGVEMAIEGDEGVSEVELKAREQAIDRALDEDAAREEAGVDGGVELESLELEVETEAEAGAQEAKKPEQDKKRRW